MEKKMSINLCSKPVCNLKHEYLHQILGSCLEKADRTGFEILPIIMDGASVNVKVARMLLDELSEKVHGKSTPIPELKLKSNFTRNRKVHFVLFCMVYLIKIFEMHYLEMAMTTTSLN